MTTNTLPFPAVLAVQATVPTSRRRPSPPVLAAYASIAALVLGGALGVGLAGLAQAPDTAPFVSVSQTTP